MKKRLLLLVGLISCILLAACGNAETSGEASGDKSLVVYSNSLSDGRGEWLEQAAAEEGFDLEFVEGGGGDILNRLLAEQANPIADVVFGLEESSFMALDEANLLVPYTPKWISEVPEEKVLSDKYSPIAEDRILMVYNQDVYSESTAPNGWSDLANNEEFHQLYKIPTSLGGATDQKIVYGILVQHLDENGELGVSEEGWNEVEKFMSNGYQTPQNEDSLVNFTEGEVPISYTYSSGLPASEEEYGFTAGMINPPNGVVTTTQHVSIINKGENQDYSVAQEFVDWFGSAEVQAEWAANFGTIPVIPEALESAQPRVKEIAEQTTPMQIDWEIVNEYLNDWIERIELEYM